VLLHLVDATGEDAGTAYKTVRHELEAYGHELGHKTEIVALSKIDALTEDEIARQKKSLKKACGREPLLISSASRQGVEEALRKLLAIIAEQRRDETVEKPSAEWEP
jgi:GTP-binding protein